MQHEDVLAEYKSLSYYCMAMRQADPAGRRKVTALDFQIAFLVLSACRLRLLETEGVRSAIRLKSNPVLEWKIAPLLKRLVGRSSRKPKVFYASFRYQAKLGSVPAGWWRKWNGT